jgi:ACS family tartrate transporter-like MFS transporter
MEDVEKRVIGKVMRRLIPFLIVCYFVVPAQPVDATQALNLSAGVSNCKVSRGRSLS